ncbi:MAG TPA: GNAT family N-acetyltransferase [Kofleriaceae bacterium]|nr:GNAT family N-acetyltransferase [Kofleriaceae bacterium]
MQPDHLAISVRRATAADAPALAALVNRAYAVEAFFVDGDRTTASEIESLIARGTFIVLEHQGGLAAAVFVEPGPTGGYIGMLSVLPELQKHGLGTRLVRIAEAMCEAAGCDAVKLQIINLREELARWYRSLGYVETGTKPYEHRPVKQPCHFVEMHKSLRGVTQVKAVAA